MLSGLWGLCDDSRQVPVCVGMFNLYSYYVKAVKCRLFPSVYCHWCATAVRFSIITDKGQREMERGQEREGRRERAGERGQERERERNRREPLYQYSQTLSPSAVKRGCRNVA